LTANDNHILIFSLDDGNSKSEAKRGLGKLLTQGSLKPSAVAVEVLEKNFVWFLQSLDRILAASPENIGGMKLDEVEIQAGIDAKGNIGISGIASAELASRGGIKFLLRKKY
jgi:hypothetical protein